jgi:hypothetical protein
MAKATISTVSELATLQDEMHLDGLAQEELKTNSTTQTSEVDNVGMIIFSLPVQVQPFFAYTRFAGLSLVAQT